MDLLQAVNQFYYDMTLNELRSMGSHKEYQSLTSRISHNSLLYLDLISYMPGCTVSRLSEILQISKPAVTSKVGELIRQGLVEKIQSETDRRVYNLRLNPAVAEEFKVFDTALRRAVRTLEKDCGEEEISVFVRMILRLNEEIQKEETIMGNTVTERGNTHE